MESSRNCEHLNIGSTAIKSSDKRAGEVRCPLILACDKHYAMQLATTLRSIVETNSGSWPLDFHILSDEVSEQDRKRILDSLPEGSATIRWVPVNLGLFKEFGTMSYISKMTYARFLIPAVFPNSISRVLYLDADILVLDDLAKLWESDLEGAVLGAVVDVLDRQVKEDDPRVNDVPRVQSYFNAGVLLIDLNQWRKERISERAIDYLTQNPKSPFADQDALNVVCDDRWKQFDPRWNFQHHLTTRISDMEPTQRPAIVHFVTSLKPWKPSSFSLNASFYDAYRSRTRFARTPRDRMGDALEGTWSQFKGTLKQYAVLQAIRNRVIG